MNKNNKAKDIVKIIEKFMGAAEIAFEEKGIEFGCIKFTCPLCQGKAQMVKYHTPKDPVHEITIRAYCENCEFSCMN